MTATTTHKLDRVEEGFARVTTLDGQALGYVSRAKHGSGRTETRWFATRLRNSMPLGMGYTRGDAVNAVLDNARRTGRI